MQNGLSKSALRRVPIEKKPSYTIKTLAKKTTKI